MKRKIIQIDEALCNGCAACTRVCAEAALEIVNGKAKLIRDFYCDGMGACLDVCPTGALQIVEKESEEYNPAKAYEHVKETRGEEDAKKIHAFDKVAKSSSGISCGASVPAPMKCGCPGTMMRDLTQEPVNAASSGCGSSAAASVSQLRQWPIQLHLVTPHAPYFKDSNLVVAADCVPFAFANFHEKFLKGRSLVMFCPKLDDGQDEYLEKLTEIFKTQNIKSVTIVRMEVPCCGGAARLVEEAIRNSGKGMVVKDFVISLRGEIIE